MAREKPPRTTKAIEDSHCFRGRSPGTFSNQLSTFNYVVDPATATTKPIAVGRKRPNMARRQPLFLEKSGSPLSRGTSYRHWPDIRPRTSPEFTRHYQPTRIKEVAFGLRVGPYTHVCEWPIESHFTTQAGLTVAVILLPSNRDMQNYQHFISSGLQFCFFITYGFKRIIEYN